VAFRELFTSRSTNQLRQTGASGLIRLLKSVIIARDLSKKLNPAEVNQLQKLKANYDKNGKLYSHELQSLRGTLEIYATR
jgi:hypothetical protein